MLPLLDEHLADPLASLLHCATMVHTSSLSVPVPIFCTLLLRDSFCNFLSNRHIPFSSFSNLAYETMTHIAQTADETGFASVWLVDHFHTIPQPSQEVTFEAWTTTAALARDTKRVRVGQMVTCNGYRNPALLAKMASTVDVLSHGRLNFGIGAGWYEHEYRAYGYDYPDAPTRLRYLREAVQVILAMWTQEEAIFEGKYHQVRGAINQPKGVQQPHIPLLIGGSGEKVTLKLVAQYADACNVIADQATLEHKFA